MQHTVACIQQTTQNVVSAILFARSKNCYADAINFFYTDLQLKTSFNKQVIANFSLKKSKDDRKNKQISYFYCTFLHNYNYHFLNNSFDIVFIE